MGAPTIKVANKRLAKIPKKSEEQKSKPDSSSRFSSQGINEIVSGTNTDVEKPRRMWLLRGCEAKCVSVQI